MVLGRGAVGLVHDPGTHEGRARRVDSVPRVHAHPVVGGCAHVPALHAGLDVRPPQRSQPLGDAHSLGCRPGGERVGVRGARAHDRLEAAQPAHTGGPRRRGHLRLVGPRPRVRRRQGAHRRAPGHDSGQSGLHTRGQGVTERHCCAAVLRSPPVQVGGQPRSLKAFARHELRERGYRSSSRNCGRAFIA